MRFALVTTAWGRPKLTDIVMRYYDRLQITGAQLECFIGISPEDDHEDELTRSAEGANFNVVSVSNDHLARKWNTVMLAARSCEPDAVMIVGSDDLITADYLTEAASHLDEYDFVEPKVIYFYDMETGRCIWRDLRLTGVRLIHPYLLEKENWKTWGEEAPRNKSMDTLQEVTVREYARYRMGDRFGAHVIDIKHPTVSRVKFKQYYRNLQGRDVDAPTFLDTHFPGVRAELEHLSATTTL